MVSEGIPGRDVFICILKKMKEIVDNSIVHKKL